VKYLILLILILTPIANAQLWIKLDMPKGSLNYIDRDSIRKEDDFAYYTMKYNSLDDSYSLVKFKHDCKYKARGVISTSDFDNKTDKLISSNINSKNEMFEYSRSARMIKVEKIVCRH